MVAEGPTPLNHSPGGRLSIYQEGKMTTVRHFTATGFVVDSGRLLLHWHPKVKAWLPPGGHIEENEDPD